MRRMVIAGSLLVFAGLMVWVFWSGFGKNAHQVPFMLAGQPAPPFKLTSLIDGRPLSLEELKGKPVVLNFWASWCKPCAYEHPVLEWGAREWSGDAQFVGLVFEDTEAEAREFLRKHGASFPQLFDPDSRIGVEYGLAGVPETYFISADGIILGKHEGPISPDVLRARMSELLSARSSAR